jgi:hypothetical protein
LWDLLARVVRFGAASHAASHVQLVQNIRFFIWFQSSVPVLVDPPWASHPSRACLQWPAAEILWLDQVRSR